MRLRAVCERSGLIFFAVIRGEQQDLALHALDLEKKKAQLMPVPPGTLGSCCFRKTTCTLHGCDMDRVAYLTSL
ncbi:hypothetical protein BAE44_0012331, partial [Dichanthelium oligosanthes]